MTIVATKNPVISEYVLDSITEIIPNHNITTATVNIAAAATLNWGDVLISKGDGDFRQIVDADGVDATIDGLEGVNSGLPNGNAVCVIVGDETGFGNGYATDVEATTDTTFTVAFRGPIQLVKDNLTYGDAIDAASLEIIQRRLESYGIELVDKADSVTVQLFS